MAWRTPMTPAMPPAMRIQPARRRTARASRQPLAPAEAAGRPPRNHPPVDGAATYNYAIDQGHDFSPGPTPAGTYTPVATTPEGSSAPASFQVHSPPIPGPPPGAGIPSGPPPAGIPPGPPP